MGSDEFSAGGPGTRLSATLDEARDRGFVGRDDEIRSFLAALSGTSPARVLILHGPGGIGKTTLLDALARHSARMHRTRVYLDARDVACSAVDVARRGHGHERNPVVPQRRPARWWGDGGIRPGIELRTRRRPTV